MAIKLPPVIDDFVKAKNNYDGNECAACFAEDAVVQDEGREVVGKTAIKKWLEDSTAKYRVSVGAKRLRKRDNETALTAQVSGSIEGSPVLLDYHFVIGKSRISREHSIDGRVNALAQWRNA